MTSLLEAARRRVRSGETDGGFALAYVMLVSAVVMMAVTTMMIVTASNIVPARQSQDRSAALAAANAGVQDAIAYLNGPSGCPRTGARCDGAIGQSNTNTRTGTDVLAGSGETFKWTVTGYVVDAAQNRYIRIVSTGKAGTQTKQLVADVQGINGVLDYEYYTTYETNGSKAITALNPAGRTILEPCSLPTGSSGVLRYTCSSSGSSTAQPVTWGGAATSSPNVSVCDRVWYNSARLNAGTSGRAAIQSTQSLTLGADWTENAIDPTGRTVSRDVPCQVAFTSGQTFDGPVYTADAPLISNGTPTGTGPLFKSSVSTAWLPTSSPAAPAQPFRSDPYVGGTASTMLTSRTNPQVFSNTFNPTVPSGTSGACVFYGPTRISLANNIATVTSPQTATTTGTLGPAACYANRNTLGQYSVAFDSVGGGIIYVKNNNAPVTGFPTTGQRLGDTPTAGSSLAKGNTVFYLSSGNPTSLPTAPADTAALTWDAALASGAKFDTEVDTTKFKSYNTSTKAPTLQTYVAGQNVTSTTNLATLLTGDFSGMDTSGGKANPAYTDRRYVATAGTPGSASTSSDSTSTVTPTITDPLYSQQNGSTVITKTTTTTTTPVTVTRQTAVCSGTVNNSKCYPCGGLLSLGCTLGCPAWTCTPVAFTWGADATQFAVQDVVTKVAYSQKSYTPATSYFPSMRDVTQYATGTGGANGLNGPGDAYVQGTTTKALSILSDDDTIVTGNLTTNPTNSTGASTPFGTLIDALDDIRIYHPVSCVDTTAADIAATSPGFCPNDITGLYSGGLVTSGALDASHPAKQYTNMGTNVNADGTRDATSQVTAISAALVAQGSDNTTGSVRTDNAGRGADLGNLTLSGGLYQRHRGTLGVQWEIKSSSTTARTSSGYHLAMTYTDLQKALPYVPVFSGASVTRYWNVVSVTSVSGSGS